jgi:hypothetical protein
MPLLHKYRQLDLYLYLYPYNCSSMLYYQRVIKFSAVPPVVLFVNDIISDDKWSTQLSIAVKYYNCSNTFRFRMFSHLQAVLITYIKSYHIKIR